MSHSTVAPVIVGLATGVAFVASVAIFTVPSSNESTTFFPRHDYHFQVSVRELKSSYEVGEQIDFVMGIKGFGNTCSNPNFAIRNADTLKVVWYSKTVIWFCDSTPKLIDESLHPEDLSIDRAPLIINETGRYEFAATFTDSNTVRGSFDVNCAK